MVLQCVQNKDRMLRSFAWIGYVPFLEELLSMGADAATTVAPLSEGGDAVMGGGDGDGEQES